jgi:Ni/Co efflux regulator RcnB
MTPMTLSCQEIDMKKIMLAASAALLIALPAVSLAQEDHPHGGGRPEGSAPPQGHPQVTPPSRPTAPPQGAPQFRGAPPPQGRGGQPGPQAFQPGGGGRPQGFVQPGGAVRPQFNGQAGQGGRGFPGGGGPRPGAQAFGYGGRQYFRYQAAPYRYPGGYYGWTNHAWRRGEWLPPVFITSSYFINDWYDFGLWQPDYGYQWIRVGADAVLINLADGQVVDVVPGVYYY